MLFTSETWALTFNSFSISSAWSMIYCMCSFIKGLHINDFSSYIYVCPIRMSNIYKKQKENFAFWKWGIFTQILCWDFLQLLYQLYHHRIFSWNQLLHVPKMRTRSAFQQILWQQCSKLHEGRTEKGFNYREMQKTSYTARERCRYSELNAKFITAVSRISDSIMCHFLNHLTTHI